MSLYAETSAVLAWLLSQEASEAVRRALDEADEVFASVLTPVECERVLVRAVTLGEMTEGEAAARRARLIAAAARWSLLMVSDEVLDRTRRAFPYEPLRTLDAIHLSSALMARPAASMHLLSLDDGVRRNGEALGFELAP